MSYINTCGGDKPVRDVSFIEIALEARRNGATSEIVFMENDTRMTLDTLWEKADSYAKGLLALGIKRGDTLSAVSALSADTVAVYLACISVGVAYVHPIVAPPRDQSMATLLDAIKPAVLLIGEGGEGQCLDSLTQTMIESPEKLEFIKQIIYDDTIRGRELSEPWIKKLDDIKRAGDAVTDEELSAARQSVQPGDTLRLFSTSGSTGTPKLVEVPNKAVVFRVEHDNLMFDEVKSISAGCLDVEAVSYAILDDVICGKMKKTVILSEKGMVEADIRPFAEMLKKEEINSTCIMKGFPKMLVDLAKNEGMTFPDLKMVVIGGQPFTDVFRSDIIDHLGAVPLSVYGQTECIIPTWCPMDAPRKQQVEGRLSLSSQSELKIVDLNGEIVPLGEDGEIWYKCPAMMSGYRGDDELTRKTISADGFIKSGDIGVIHPDKTLEVKGRKSDCLRFKINQKIVYPSYVEQAVEKFPGVSECAVISAQVSETYGDELTYCIRLDSNVQSLDEKKLVEFIVQETSDLCRACRILYFDAFPMVDTGRKVSKARLKDLVVKQMDDDPNAGMTEWYKKFLDSRAV